METRRLLPSCGVRFSTTGTKASLISTVSIRWIDIPVRLRPCWIAGIGAVEHHHRVGAAYRHVVGLGSGREVGLTAS